MTAAPVRPDPAARDREALAALHAMASPQQRLMTLLREAPAGPPPDGLCVDACRVDGCVSALWIRCWLSEQGCRFETWSDARVVHALVSWLARTYDGCDPRDLAHHPSRLLAEAGVVTALGPNRRTALSRAWTALQEAAAMLMT